MIWVTDAEYIENYTLLITFNDNVKRLVDLQNELNEGIFIALKDKEYFRKFHISANTVEWENGADFAPEFLRLLSETKAVPALNRMQGATGSRMNLADQPTPCAV
ncbi:MAG: hypothetical protein B6245_22390 [Desulfobacteraceae bacterium 4572_88]|nr:MAG: hypothetical protein B6245_22390 [Desulfobacteraceae bacterium 4572_88]